MSKENVQKFYEVVQNDPELQAQFKTVSDADSFVQLAVKLAAAHGYEFTPEEAKEAIEEGETELTDEQLTQLAGGVDGTGCGG